MRMGPASFCPPERIDATTWDHALTTTVIAIQSRASTLLPCKSLRFNACTCGVGYGAVCANAAQGITMPWRELLAPHGDPLQKCEAAGAPNRPLAHCMMEGTFNGTRQHNYPES